MTLIRSENADAEVVGHVIILGLTITGIAMITLVGVPTIYKLEEMVEVRNVEQTYTLLDSRISKVALGEAPQQSIEINLGESSGGSVSVVANSSSEQSYILFELKNGTNIITSIQIPMGKIIYTLGDREVAYEGGGVWSKYPAGSVMLSPPEFNYNGVTLTLPVVNITGNYSAGGRGAASISFEKKGNAQMIYPNATYKNPIPENVTNVNITIKSEYYDAWGDYFRSIALTRVSTYPGEKKVIIALETPPLITNFSYGALASESIVLENNAETDSYNSSKGKYSVSKSGNGSIRATKTIDIANNAIVNGSALTSGDITGGGTIKKDAYAKSFGSVTVNGNKYPAAEGLSLGSTTNLVQSKINEYKAFNNNNDSSAGGCLSGAVNTTLDSTSWSTCTISTGNYYLATFSLDNNDILIFDTSSGQVNLAVDTDFDIKNGANITVSGTNPVRLYLTGGIDIHNGADINPTTNDKSSLFQVISSSSQDIELSNTAYFCGFIWAPEAEIEVDNNMEVYGALVGEEFELKQNQEMHFDEALQNLNTNVATGTTVMYIYITRNDVEAHIS